MIKFVQFALERDDEDIEYCQLSLDVFFDEIIRDEELVDQCDPRRSCHVL